MLPHALGKVVSIAKNVLTHAVNILRVFCMQPRPTDLFCAALHSTAPLDSQAPRFQGEKVEPSNGDSTEVQDAARGREGENRLLGEGITKRREADALGEGRSSMECQDSFTFSH